MQVKVCVVQDSPAFFDKEQTLQKLEEIVKTNASKGCELIIFPESFVPGYPRGFTFGATIGKRTDEGRELYTEYHQNSISLDGDDRIRLEKIAEQYNVYLVVGVTEKKVDNGSLYCSMCYISPSAGLLGVHRKIKPTGTERIIWAEAGGESLVTVATKIGRLGGLICWENYMPMARLSMYKKGVQIYIAPTADSREEWISTMKHIALEGRCFVLGCNQYFTKSIYPSKYQYLLKNEAEDICPGGSVIISPSGKILEGPLYGKQGVLIATIDLNEVINAKLDFDTNGHYSRPDIFNFSVNNQPDIIKEKG